jgi:hypothetical protein
LQEEEWQTDSNAYVADEDEVNFSYNARMCGVFFIKVTIGKF